MMGRIRVGEHNIIEGVDHIVSKFLAAATAATKTNMILRREARSTMEHTRLSVLPLSVVVVLLLCTTSSASSRDVLPIAPALIHVGEGRRKKTGVIAGAYTVRCLDLRQRHPICLLRAGNLHDNTRRKGSNGDDDDDAETAASKANSSKYAPDASSLFANVRIPAALFAGAAAGAAFGMPIATSDGLKVGLVKRVYALCMIACLSSQLIAIVVSTLALEALARKRHLNAEAGSAAPLTLSDFMEQNYDLEWTTTKLHFFAGILTFVFGSGIRSWIAISCPVVAKAALLLILSATALAISFLEEGDAGCSNDKPLKLIRLAIKYWRLMFQKSLRNPWFGISFLLSLVTYGYILMNVNHVYQYLASKASP